MKIAIVNDIHVGKPLLHDGQMRASSHLIEARFSNFLQGVKQQHQPDLLINLGDLIRSENQEVDLSTYRRILSHFTSLALPILHLVGNHELKMVSLNDIEKVWQELGFEQKSYGRRQIDNVTLLWLGLEMDPLSHKIRTLPSNQLCWLEGELKPNRPTIIFTHCAIDDHDLTGNFFYEATDFKDKRGFFLQNQKEIRAILSSSKCVVAVIQAHLHYFHAKKIDDIPYITCPAMGDNICGPNIRDNVPEIYTILAIEKNRIVVKAFSGKYCFAGYESSFV